MNEERQTSKKKTNKQETTRAKITAKDKQENERSIIQIIKQTREKTCHEQKREHYNTTQN